MAQHINTGITGEQLASRFLEQAGYTVVEKNYRYKKAEIDIVAKKDNVLVFVEVKTRSSKSFGEPEEAVNQSKINLILSAAENFIEVIDWKYDIRFDVIAIHYTHPLEIVHFQDAFH
jgi:putative endonuclease